jgi:hypothetical protein
LIRRGRFRLDHRHHELLRLHIAYGVFMRPRLSSACSLSPIVRLLLNGLGEAGMIGTREIYGELAPDERKIFRALKFFLMRSNGRGSYQVDPLDRLRPYLRCWSLSEWYQRITDAMSFPLDLPDANSCAGDDLSDEAGTEPEITGAEPESAPEDDSARTIDPPPTRVLSGEPSVGAPDADSGGRDGPSDAAETEPGSPGPKANERPKGNQRAPSTASQRAKASGQRTPSPSQGPEARQKPKGSRSAASQGPEERAGPKASQEPMPGPRPKTRPAVTPRRSPALSATLAASSDAGPGGNE